MEFKHYSVLLEETIEHLNIRPDGIYVDGTLGGAGHASEVAKRLSEKGRLIGIDQDADAIRAAGERLKPFGDKVTIIRSNYANMKEELHAIGIEHVDGIVLDLGVSSLPAHKLQRGSTPAVAAREFVCLAVTGQRVGKRDQPAAAYGAQEHAPLIWRAVRGAAISAAATA